MGIRCVYGGCVLFVRICVCAPICVYVGVWVYGCVGACACMCVRSVEMTE